MMSAETAVRFRMRAHQCREMAAEVREDDWRETLLGLAQDLEDEAHKIETEEQDT